MTAITWGTGGTLQSITSVEDYFAGAVNYLYGSQNTSAKNPTNLRYLTRTISSTATMSGELSVPATFSGDANGDINVTVASYLTSVVWTPPTGGDAQPDNEVIAVIDAARRLKVLELNSATNPNNANYISVGFTMGSSASGNGTVNISFSGFPLDVTVANNGDITYSGKVYLS